MAAGGEHGGNNGHWLSFLCAFAAGTGASLRNFHGGRVGILHGVVADGDPGDARAPETGMADPTSDESTKEDDKGTDRAGAICAHGAATSLRGAGRSGRRAGHDTARHSARRRAGQLGGWVRSGERILSRDTLCE
jgi:hypothetical protein